MLDTRDPILIADAGPLIRLAAAGLLDAMRLTNRQIVITDMVEEEVVTRRPDKPFASEIGAWLDTMGEAVKRVETREGVYVGVLRSRPPTPENQADLKRQLRDSGERSIRDYIESINPADVDEVLVLHEDKGVQVLMRASVAPVRLMTTRAFARLMGELGLNRDAPAALDGVAGKFAMAPDEEIILRPFDEGLDEASDYGEPKF